MAADTCSAPESDDWELSGASLRVQVPNNQVLGFRVQGLVIAGLG